jgi:hypothetical protein
MMKKNKISAGIKNAGIIAGIAALTALPMKGAGSTKTTTIKRGNTTITTTTTVDTLYKPGKPTVIEVSANDLENLSFIGMYKNMLLGKQGLYRDGNWDEILMAIGAWCSLIGLIGGVASIAMVLLPGKKREYMMITINNQNEIETRIITQEEHDEIMRQSEERTFYVDNKTGRVVMMGEQNLDAFKVMAASAVKGK